MSEMTNTARYDDMRWITPVEDVAGLPLEGVPDGALCYVQSENAVYQLVAGMWIKSAARGTPEPRAR